MTDFDKFGRRGKPQREIYTPGSGPLRKSGKEESIQQNDSFYRSLGSYSNVVPSADRSAETSKVTEKFKKMTMNTNLLNDSAEIKSSSDNLKKSRKPDYEIYVPKPVAEAQANRLKGRDVRSMERQINEVEVKQSGKGERNRRNDRKRKGKRLNSESDHGNGEKSFTLEKLKSREPLCHGDRDDYSQNRFVRYGSEPRSLPMSHGDKLKDLRTVDTSWVHEKTLARPPLGRRGSLSKGFSKPFSSFDSLPPRLKKKYIAENNLNAQETISYTGNPSDGSPWDGSSVTFQGNPSTQKEQNKSEDNLITQKTPRSLAEWSKTLPPSHTKGRGRLNRECRIDFHENARYSRSLTPETIHSKQFENAPEDRSERGVMRPLSSHNINEKENKVRNNSKTQSKCRNLENSTQEELIEEKHGVSKQSENSGAETVLDWAAEVERFEQEDIVVSPSSKEKEPFLQPAPRSSRDKKKRRNRKPRVDQKERSLSREGSNINILRRGSVDNISNYSRNNSIERNWREKSDDNLSRKNSFCDNRSRQSSIDRRENFNNRFPRSRQNSSCDNRSRQSSLDKQESLYKIQRQQIGREDKGGRRGRSKESRDAPRLMEETNWRLEQELIQRERDITSNCGGKTAGILVLPQPIKEAPSPLPPNPVCNALPQSHARKLYDPCNPDKPIVVPSNRPNIEDETKFLCNTYYPDIPSLISASLAEQLTASKPIWYNPYTDNFQASHNPQLIRGIEQADSELQYLLSTNELLKYWERMQLLRSFLKEALVRLLRTDLRFCEVENVEQHFWKILFYNVIELLRKLMVDKPEAKESYKQALLSVIEEGSEYYEQLLNDLEISNNIKLEVFLNTPMCMRENLKYTVLSLIAAQKIYLSLGDLARYREQANETCNYGVARQWYMKAHQINPKNGRPYNQLALLALYTKRKLDAVYYYMRCLMSSNPITAARESLVALFDESRKKYEASDRKRKEEKAKKEREKMKEKEGGGGIRREIWIHPGGRKNMHRTTSTCKTDYDSEDEELYAASDIEVNKRFLTSYLHVHGKIFTKIGLESLTETAVQMLKQFRALLQHSPLPLNSNRFLQLFALNMFSIEISQPKGDMVNSSEGCYRSVTQESALVISLQMFNLLLERFVKVLQDHINSSTVLTRTILPSECLEMLPALKVWCDWLMTHVEIWNPPPSCQDYKVGPAVDCWSRIATMVNLLEKIDYNSDLLSSVKHPDYELVYLSEDAILSEFTPLMANIHEPKYRHVDVDLELAQVSLRINKILFFGTVFLCGLDPPVLKLQKIETGDSEYISIVDSENTQDQVLIDENETWSESEDSGKETGQEEDESEMVGLAARRRQLQQQAKSRLSQVVRISNALTEMEVRPHDLVPDTNCFIECLPELETILRVLPHPQHPYVFMVPLVVVNELEGLSRGCKPSQSVHHSALVRETAKAAMNLFQKRHPSLRTCTTRGTVLSSTTFTLEEDSDVEMTNDDKILTTCMNLCRTFNKDETKEGGKRKLYRDVVLLTEDRNLALKAMARDMPVRSLPDFMRWAGLG